MQTKTCDILIIGGGLIGGTLALALAKLPIKIVMIEQEPLVDQATSAYDDRGIAISPASKNILDTLGLWQAVEKTVQAISQIHVSEQGSFAKAVLSAKEMRVDALGFVCSGIVLGRVIKSNLESCVNIERITPARLVDITGGIANVKLIDSEQNIAITAKVIAGVDGAKSKVRELLNIKAKTKSYEHLAVTCNVSFAKAHAGRAFERFTQDGPLAVLPLVDNKSALIWTMPTYKAQDLISLDDGQIIEKLHKQFGFRLGAVNKLGKIKTYPLVLMVAKQLIKNNVVLLGNAAQTLHPVAGQGFNLGLRDVSALHEGIKNAIEQKTNLADSLAVYAKSREHDRDSVIFLSDGLPSIFTNDSFLFKAGRNLGLLGFSCLPFMRKIFTNRAMGKNGRAALLQRGLE